MARKKRADVVQYDERVQEALDEWEALTEVRYEIAKAALDCQDEKTQALLMCIVDQLRAGATDHITVAGLPVPVSQQQLDQNLLYVATEILKDLAMFDIRVGTYKLPPSLCVNCGAELTIEKPKGRANA